MISRLCITSILILLFYFDAHAGKLLSVSDLVYVGAFRVPHGNLGGASSIQDTMASGGAGLAYNPVNNSLLITTSYFQETLITEISIPTIKSESQIANLNTASVIQAPANVANGQWSNLGINNEHIDNGGRPGGLLVNNGMLIGSAYVYYDGATEAHRSHFSANTSWSGGTGFSGMKRVGQWPGNATRANGGLVGGYMANIPNEWRAALGFEALTGKGALAVIDRSSQGPAIWGFNPQDVATQDPVNATMLAGYYDTHNTLGQYTPSGGTQYYGMGTDYSGMAFPVGSDSVLIFGRHGYGFTGDCTQCCYGTGTSDSELHNTFVNGVSGELYCYDPPNHDHGNHCYPYSNHVWIVSAHDLAAVKAGTKNPWEVVPYASGAITLPFSKGFPTNLGVAYDPSTQRIFLAQAETDTIYNPYEYYPIIHVFTLTGFSVKTRYRLGQAPVIQGDD